MSGAILSALVLAALTCCTAAVAGGSPRRGTLPRLRKGMCWGHGKTGFYNHLYNYSSAAANASLVALKSTGANSVQIETAWYMDDCNATTIHPQPYTPPDAALRSAIEVAHQLGMETMINAHIEVSCRYDSSCPATCGGRTDIDFGDNTAKWDRWFASYTAFIVHHATLCEQSAGCGLLAVHVELQEIGAHLPDIGDRWKAVIAAARKHFSGELTASCNGSPGISGGQALNISYWHLLDYVGIDTFPAVTGNPVRSRDVSAAFETLLQNLAPLFSGSSAKQARPQLLFTQIGYPSCAHCGEKGALRKYPTVDEHCQAQAYTGILDVLMSAKYASVVAGMYFWNWLPCSEPSQSCAVGSRDNGESPQGKAAEAIVRRFYSNTSSQEPGICSSVVDCSLNGDCASNGVCRCLPPWLGSAECDVLAVEPTPHARSGYHNDSAASWGGNVVFEDGQYSLFVSQMAEGCGLEHYGSNSMVVRATASSPTGPFKYAQTVLEPFGHNPTIRRMPHGAGFLIYFIGGNNVTTVNCRGNLSHLAANSQQRQQQLVGGSVHVIHSKSLYGPWSAPVQVHFDDENASAWQGGGTNPSPHIDLDGTVTLAVQRQYAPSGSGKELIGVARASTWRGPYTMITPAPIQPEHPGCIAGTGEDPFLYKSKRGYHIIFHGMCPTGMFQAHYAFSLDAIHWHVSPRQTYSYDTKYADGTSQLFTRVERPQLSFLGGADSGEDSIPNVLYNGVCAASTPTEVYGCLELKSPSPVMTWTLARQLRLKTDDFSSTARLSTPDRSVLAEACNLNGEVHGDGSCTCLAAWTGPTCGELALQPAKRAAGLHSQGSLSSWGGSVAYDGLSKRWVMFGNELVGECGINSWESNSRIVRASTDDLDKPFIVDDVLLSAFASEPSLARLGDEWLLYSIGNSSSTRPPRADCKDGYTPKAPPPNGTGGNFIGFVPVSVRKARNLTASSGNWKLNGTFGNGDFNPAPWVFSNGTTLLMWRHLARVHMVRSQSIGGPFAFNGSDSGCEYGAATTEDTPGCRWWHLFPPAVDKRGVEDPFIFIQKDPPQSVSSVDEVGSNISSPGNNKVPVTFHALFHDHKSFGGHAYSRDGVTWTYSDVPPFNNNVSFVDGSVISMERRERPHLIFDENGYISHLVNGVQPPPTSQKSPPTGAQNDYVYTLVQPVQAQDPSWQ